jgi:hypothetical protein
VAGVAVFSIEGTLSVVHFAPQKALVATWISMVTPHFREGLERGLDECGRLGAITWIVDLTRNPGVPTQSDLIWIEKDCVEICQRNRVRAVINIHGKSAVATMGAKRWSKSANANGMSTYDCTSLGDALALAADIASGKAA